MTARLARLAGVLVLLTLLASCVSFPDDGPVRQGDPEVAEPGSVALLIRPPDPGDGPQQIVEGFLRAAAAGLTDDFVVAREFLTGTVKEEWDPLAQVTVLSGEPLITNEASVGAYLVVADASAVLDAAGRYTEAVPGATARLAVGLELDPEGRWRISDVPDGSLLPEAVFRSLYQKLPLHFVTPAGGALAAETRWFPRRDAAASAVRGLLHGPSPWLAEGAASRFPDGAELAADAVPVRDGIAQVDLSREVRAVREPSRGLMLAQLNETLTGLPHVDSVTVTAGGTPLDMSGVPTGLVVDPSVGTNPVVLAGDALWTVEGVELEPWQDARTITAAAPSHPAVGYGGEAVVLSGQTALVTVAREGVREATLLSGQDVLSPPSFDRFGWVWTAPEENRGFAIAARTGERVEVDAPWLDEREVLALRVSREGARVLVLSVDGVTVSLEVAAVTRDAAGRPQSLGAPLQIGQRIARASTAAWVDRQTVAVLGQLDGATSDTVLLSVVGGPTSALPVVEDAVGIAAGKGDQLIVLVTGSGELYSRSGLDWTQTAQNVRDPAFPG